MDLEKELEKAHDLYLVAFYEGDISQAYNLSLMRLKNLVFILGNKMPGSPEYHTARAVYASVMASFFDEDHSGASFKYLGDFYEIIPSEEEARRLTEKCIKKHLESDEELVLVFRAAEKFKAKLNARNKNI